jgi:very-short-patch-repair endonuclease
MTKGDGIKSKVAHRPVKPRLRGYAKSMRQEPTDAEAKMWRLLRDRRLSTFKFRRQVPLDRYILDFVCFEKRFVVEIDGGQHATSTTDEVRNRFLAAQGFEIARYWNNDVLKQPTSVLEDIFAKLTRDGDTQRS